MFTQSVEPDTAYTATFRMGQFGGKEYPDRPIELLVKASTETQPWEYAANLVVSNMVLLNTGTPGVCGSYQVVFNTREHPELIGTAQRGLNLPPMQGTSNAGAFLPGIYRFDYEPVLLQRIKQEGFSQPVVLVLNGTETHAVDLSYGKGTPNFMDYVDVQLYPKNIAQNNLLDVITSEKGATVTAARITIVTESKLGE